MPTPIHWRKARRRSKSTATAIAVEQEAENGDLSRNDVLNDGLISAFASAEAYAVEDGDAYAQATGVYQSADAWGANAVTPPQSINYVTNAGTIQAAAYATVGGLPDDGDEVEVQPPALALAVEPAWVRPVPLLAADDGDGTAYATGIYQNAEDAVTGTNQVYNEGTVKAYANSWVKAEDANSYASAVGVHQDFSEVGTAYSIVDNLWGALIEAEAKAVASDDADCDGNRNRSRYPCLR